ncbi:HDIG domain-containing protein [candidate division WOR-3 bacterium]|nr:HDIG domain-containing protein [candidate division WOR-3 bacterium]
MKRKILRRLLLALSAIAVLIAVNLAPLLAPPVKMEYKEGNILSKDLYAPIPFPLPKDPELLAAQQDSAGAQVLPVLIHDKDADLMLDRKMRNLHNLDSIPEGFSASTRELLTNPKIPGRASVLSAADSLIEAIRSQMYLRDKEELASSKVTILMQIGEVEERVDNLLDYIDLDTLVENAAQRLFPHDREKFEALYSIVLRTMSSNYNLVYDNEETARRRSQARNQVGLYEGYVERGELIAEANKPIDKATVKKLHALNLEQQGNWKLRAQLFLRQNLLYILVLGILGITIFLLKKDYKIREFLYVTLLLITGIIASLALRRFSSWWFVPTGFIALGCAIFLGSLEGIILTMVSSVLLYLPWHNEPEYLLYALLVGFGGLLALPLMKRRTGFLAALGFFLVGGLLARASFLLTTANLSVRELPGALLGIGINSTLNFGFLLAAFVAAERVFGFTSTLTLARLADLNRPLFREFALKASGSYHHSILVGNLAERGARAIGANPDLSLAGGYYHDIGKMAKPEYFIENLVGNSNPHDSLKPKISALILSNHVKKALVTAERMGLPEPVRDIIAQHHGTTRMEYFYQKYLKSGTKDQVPESEFRYPGPKPQTKEAALVMLADSVEAAVRSQGFKDKEDLEKIIKNILDLKVSEGQLDECAFTTADIHKVREVFVSILIGTYHPRISYEHGKDSNRGAEENASKKNRSSHTRKKNT